MRQLKITKSISNRENASLEKYLQEIGKIKLLTGEQEVELVQRIRKGDKIALEKLIKSNLRFVVSVAKQYQHQGIDLPDLINEGNVGLIKAAERFDETRGFKLISYAVWWIRQSILQALAEQARIVRLPINKTGTINRINKAYSALEQEYERPPTAAELAEALDVSEEDATTALKTPNNRHVSLDAPLLLSSGESDSLTLLDGLPSDYMPTPDHVLMQESLKLEIARALSSLTSQEANVMRMFFGVDGRKAMTLEEIGEEIDLTRERVRQIREKAIKRLRNTSRSKLLKTFLG